MTDTESGKKRGARKAALAGAASAAAAASGGAIDPLEKKARRKEQNRRAQFNFRQRQEEHVRSLEQAAVNNQVVGEENTRRLQAHVAYLKSVVGTLLEDNKVLLESLRSHPDIRVDLAHILTGEQLLQSGLKPEPELLAYQQAPVHQQATGKGRNESAYPDSPPPSDEQSPNGSLLQPIKREVSTPQYAGTPHASVMLPPIQNMGSMVVPSAISPYAPPQNQFSNLQPLLNAASLSALQQQHQQQQQYTPSVQSFQSPGLYGAAPSPASVGSNYYQQSPMLASNLQQNPMGGEMPFVQASTGTPSSGMDDPVFTHFPIDDALFGSLLNSPVPDDLANEGLPASLERPPINIFSEFANRLLAQYGIFLDIDPNMDPNNASADVSHVRMNELEMPMMPVMNVPSPVPSPPQLVGTPTPEICVMPPPANAAPGEQVDRLSRCIQALPNVTMREKIKALRKSRFVDVDKLCEDVRSLARCHGNPQDVKDWSLPKGFFDRWPVLRGIPVRER